MKPNSALVKYAKQSIVLTLFKVETDSRNNPIPKKPITIDNVVVQKSSSLVGENNSRSKQYTHVIFIYSGISKPIPIFNEKLDLGAKVEFESETYTIVQIVTNKDPFSNQLFSYELEVK